MNVFVLCTGRCGSMTFARACAHITNYTSAHESRSHYFGAARLDYPDRHIEVDNRLAWLLGPLESKYGSSAYYVHLVRDPEAVAQSFLRRWGTGIMDAFAHQIVMRWESDWPESQRLSVCRYYVEIVTCNIRAFLKNKEHMEMDLKEGPERFREFWARIGAVGDIEAAVSEFAVCYNAS